VVGRGLVAIVLTQWLALIRRVHPPTHRTSRKRITPEYSECVFMSEKNRYILTHRSSRGACSSTLPTFGIGPGFASSLRALNLQLPNGQSSSSSSQSLIRLDFAGFHCYPSGSAERKSSTTYLLMADSVRIEKSAEVMLKYLRSPYAVSYVCCACAPAMPLLCISLWPSSTVE
jgi:hypothetical protein